MKINFKIRFRQKQFIVAIISALLLLVQQIAKIFGYEIVTDGIIQLVNVILSLLVMIGVVIDPTTKGLSDLEKNEKENENGK